VFDVSGDVGGGGERVVVLLAAGGRGGGEGIRGGTEVVFIDLHTHLC
jgi:hypothetical protein